MHLATPGTAATHCWSLQAAERVAELQEELARGEAQLARMRDEVEVG